MSYPKVGASWKNLTVYFLYRDDWKRAAKEGKPYAALLIEKYMFAAL